MLGPRERYLSRAASYGFAVKVVQYLVLIRRGYESIQRGGIDEDDKLGVSSVAFP